MTSATPYIDFFARIQKVLLWCRLQNHKVTQNPSWIYFLDPRRGLGSRDEPPHSQRGRSSTYEPGSKLLVF